MATQWEEEEGGREGGQQQLELVVEGITDLSS